MKNPRNARHEGKSTKNREKGMNKSKTSRGRHLLTGVSAAAVATGFGVDARAEDADHRHRLEIGLGISRLQIEAPNQTFEPFWADDWDDTHFDLPLSVPNRDLEDGFAGELWLSFRPQGGPWAVSAGARSGKTSMSAWAHETETDLPEILKYPGSDDTDSPDQPNFVSVRAERHEEFAIVDFEVGRDVGLGFLGEGSESHVAVGLRYAQFKSNTTDVTMDGMPNRYDPPYAVGKYYNADTFEADFESRREFQGWGPSASWTASKRLFGSERAGHVALDWALGGGVLFGKQETEVDYDVASRYYVWPAFGLSQSPPGRGNPQDEELDEASHEREDNLAVVPFADLDLGLSYKLERLRVSLGYKLEEYFGAIDGGVDERRVYDRTFHGPYLRVSVGFGDGGESEQ